MICGLSPKTNFDGLEIEFYSLISSLLMKVEEHIFVVISVYGMKMVLICILKRVQEIYEDFSYKNAVCEPASQ